MIRRRSFLGKIAAAAAVPAHAQITPGQDFVDVLRTPDRIAIFSTSGRLNEDRSKRVSITAEPTRLDDSSVLPIIVHSPEIPLERICLRWQGHVSDGWRLLGDHWERSYGDLEWRNSVPNRVMPWYFLASDNRVTHGVGVKTGCSAFCFWHRPRRRFPLARSS